MGRAVHLGLGNPLAILLSKPGTDSAEPMASILELIRSVGHNPFRVGFKVLARYPRLALRANLGLVDTAPLGLGRKGGEAY
jgi:hypothetical protein